MKVVIAAAMAANGSVENEKIRRADVCALMITGPNALIEDCNITDPSETMDDISPMARPWLSKSKYNSSPRTKSFLEGTRKLTRFLIYTKHRIAEIPCAIIVATAAPATPMCSCVMQKISRMTFTMAAKIKK